MSIFNLKPHFNLRSSSASTPQLLYLVCTINNKQIKIPTKLKVYPKDWDKHKEIAIVSNIQPKLIQVNNREVNNELELLLSKFETFIDYIYNTPNCDKEAVLRSIYKNKVNELSLLDSLTNAINNMNNSISTKRKYQTDIVSFNTFIIKSKLRISSINKINQYTLKRYESYLKEECNLKDTTVKNKIEVLLIILNSIGYTVSDYKLPKAKKELFEIYLTEDELSMIYNTKFNGAVEYSRDLFILQCQLGQRYSDMNLSKAIINDNTIELIQQKTTARVIIPLNNTAKEILNKYNLNIYLPDKNTYNRHIKLIAKTCNISDLCLKDNKKIPKYELVSSHTARRTFITNAIKNGLSESLIMKITGHKSRSSFDLYNKLNADDVANVFSEKNTRL